MIPEDKSKSEQIMFQALLINDYLVTIKKSILADGQDIGGFVDHYSDLIQVALDLNWEIHNAAEAISRDDFRQTLKIDR